MQNPKAYSRPTL